MATAAMTGWDMAPPAHAYALDFDGVLVDSADETGYSAFRATKRLWPDIFLPDLQPEDIISRFRKLRPVIETGYENILLMRLMMEGVDDSKILSSFRKLKVELLARLNVPKDELIQRFGRERDLWIEEDPATWIAINRFFPGTVDAVNFSSSPVFVITTKQRRFCTLLLSSAGVTLPDEHIFAVPTGLEKAEIIQQLMQRDDCQGRTFHFVEDRLDTLEAVASVPGMKNVRLYLARWGYNTKEERDRALETPNVRLLDLGDFVKMQ
mmetsp:Transcript_17971/g.29844  ORF Transcript_17971/g.29844 Transcript_17971/m.29844 type:complete len:266 (+) Transcript_17971:21-818(+)